MPGGFLSVDQVADAVESGKTHFQHFFKFGFPFAGQSKWIDGSVSTGLPTYNAYVAEPLTGNEMNNAGNSGIYTGPSLGDQKSKYLLSMGLSFGGTGIPATAILVDYLVYYPFIDCDSTDTQFMTINPELPRYNNVGGRLMLVTQVPNTDNGTSTATLSCVLADDSEFTFTVRMLGSSTIGAIIHSAEVGKAAALSTLTPFIPLGSSTLGIKSLKNITFDVPFGGFCTAVIVQPIATMSVFEQQTFTEKTFLQHTGTLPEIKPNAFLNLVCNHGANATLAPVHGYINLIWS